MVTDLAAWEYAADQFGKPDHALNPLVWIEDVLSEFAWSIQREILESVRDNRYTAVPSCHDSGKSFIASRTITWWISTNPQGDAFVVSTAPTAAQVSAILWREIGRAHKKAKLLGRILSAGYPQWKASDGELIGYGRKPADYEDSAFQGIHALKVLVVIDEAGGIPRNLWDQVDTLLTNDEARVLAIGNPDDAGSHFASICKPGSGWNVIQIDGLRTPNMVEEGIEEYPLLRALMHSEGIPYSTEEIPDSIRPLLLSRRWVEERLQRWAGVNPAQLVGMSLDEQGQLVRRRAAGSALVVSKVRGQFPDSSSDGVIPLGWAQQAMNRWRDWVDSGSPPLPGRRVVGVDVAGEGEDETAIAVRQGLAIQELHRYRKADTMETVANTELFLDSPHALAIVDVIGIGAGVRDRLRQLQYDVLAFNASAQSERRDYAGDFKFRNDRSAAWWRMRELLDPSRNSKVMIPDDERLLEELVAPKWKVFTGGVIVVESKDDIRKRLGRSTDSADAVIQSYWVDGLPVGGDSGAADAVPWGTPVSGGAIPYGGVDAFDDDDLFNVDEMGNWT